MGLATLTFDCLTLKLVCELHLRCGTFLPNLGTLGLWVLKGTLRRRIAYIYFLVHQESIYYEIFFYSKIVPNCAVAK